MKKEIFINGHRWKFVEELKKGIKWTADWWCPDGDAVTLYIDKKEKGAIHQDGGFTLQCFSGIHASKIYIDKMDFNHIIYQRDFPQKIRDGFWAKVYIKQCLILADYICEKFCEYH